jgi:hypothetical protein
MRHDTLKVRLWVIAPFLLYLLVFLLWVLGSRGAPTAASTRWLGYLFGGMTAILAALYLFARVLFGRYGNTGLLSFMRTAHDFWETFIDGDSTRSPSKVSEGHAGTPIEPPPLVITKRMRNGTPIRGLCPLCEVDFSTEAFAGDPSYPHESRLNEWYLEHYEAHLHDQ